ncbi:MAG: sigma-70 family RNA polymerase sigma factor [Gemmatimonadota bacterium]
MLTDAEREIELLFKRESGRLIAVLTRILGPKNLELAEDVVQESFVAALHTWEKDGVPENASAWLLTTARNRAVDAIRRERTRRTFAPDLAMYLDSEWTLSRTVEEAFREDWVKDDQLRMIFMCCAPAIAPENRLPLILKTLCGLSVAAIARGLLTTESTINKRLYRTRKALADAEFRLPTAEELPHALRTVHTILYLIFNEGYFSTTDRPIRDELCRDAIGLTRLLVDEPSASNSETVALLAVMTFSLARLPARLDSEGRWIPLDRQDRSLWSQELISAGYTWLHRSSNMEAVRASRFHLEAAIAARHCSAPSFEETDWASICNLYDRLLDLAPSAMTRLNRAVAISYRSGPGEAIPLVEELRMSGELPHSHVVAAALAHLYARADRPEEAEQWLETALAHVTSEHERRLIERQVRRD